MSDTLEKYLFPDHATRVQIVRLTDSWQAGLQHQHYPACVQRLLGELTAAATLMAANLKFQGSLTLQLQGSGPVALIVVECTADLTIRASATLRENADIPADGDLQMLLNPDGNGKFTVILDPRNSGAHFQPYQGIVPLEGASVADVLEQYMRDSQQLDTRLWLAADATQAGGLLLQRLPDHGGTPSDAGSAAEPSWPRALHLAATVQTDELLSLPPGKLAHRLFWEEELLVFVPHPVRWHCPCTRERVATMLRMLGEDEVRSILTEREHIDVSCNFCGKPYAFDAVDCASLFVDATANPDGARETLH